MIVKYDKLYKIISGSIYVWASGDGGPFDDCNLDGYASSMWTIRFVLQKY